MDKILNINSKIYRCFTLTILWMLIFPLASECQQAVEIQRYKINDSIHLQGIAVDKSFFYVITNNSIFKYNKR